MQHNPVCVVLDINLNLDRAFKTKAGEVWVQQEMIVKRNNVPVEQKAQNMIKTRNTLASVFFFLIFIFVHFKKRTLKGTLGGVDGSRGRTDRLLLG